MSAVTEKKVDAVSTTSKAPKTVKKSVKLSVAAKMEDGPSTGVTAFGFPADLPTAEKKDDTVVKKSTAPALITVAPALAEKYVFSSRFVFVAHVLFWFLWIYYYINVHILLVKSTYAFIRNGTTFFSQFFCYVSFLNNSRTG